MKCQGNFVFKTITHRDAGVFKNSEGVDIQYPAAYVLKVDEVDNKGNINERKFKIDEKNTLLVNALKSLEAYQKIIIDFEVTLLTNRISLEVTDISIDED